MITAVALAVAALPEGLPIVLTITSALGIKRMVNRHVLIRRLMSVETLGSVTVICTDKTGTLTKNQMTVQALWINGQSYTVSGEGYDAHGAIDAPKTSELLELLRCGALCNNASIFESKVTGDPTEVALLVSATKGGVPQDGAKRLAEVEFTSERKLMSTVHEQGGQMRQYVKGAVDELLLRSTHIMASGKVRAITAKDKKAILSATHEYSSSALRVLGFAYRTPSKPTDKETDVKKLYPEKDLVFIGMQAMMDPPREEVRNAIAQCKDAGIKIVMITGDHPDTASAVAQKLGLGTKILSGNDIDNVDLNDVVEDVVIYARVNPEHKLKIVHALQRRGHVVAMTGDGVNDAPALAQADIGVAMGITGTDVAKEASKMIITDDNFTSIVAAVEEGRSIYENIQRFVRYQLSTNVGAILLVIMSIILAFPLPLMPLQLLWINLSIDGPPALSLGLEPSDPAVLKKKPKPKKEPLLTRKLVTHIFVGGLIMAIGTLLVFISYLDDSVKATTMAFTTFAFFQFFNVLNCRNMDESIFKNGLFTNRMATWSIAATLCLHLLILYVPFLQRIFDTTALSIRELIICVAVASTILILYELWKIVHHVAKKVAPKATQRG
jgi:Ca2+-transporting ATPase